MGRHYGNIVLITGASSGIGKTMAEYLAAKGYKVYGTSRKPQAVNSANQDGGSQGGGAQDGGSQGGGAQGGGPCNAAAINMLQMDVRSEESVKQAVEKVIELEGELGIVINNAGMGVAGSVEDTSPEEAFLQFDTNFFGMHRVIRQALPHMRKRGRGLFINISSVGALFPIPYQSMYVASKAAVEGMSGCLRNELKPFGIKVSIVEPGDTKTGFVRVFANEGEDSVYKEYSKKSIAVMERDEENGMDPVAVARVVGKIIKRKNPPICVITGFQYKLLALIKRLAPKAFESFIVRIMYKG